MMPWQVRWSQLYSQMSLMNRYRKRRDSIRVRGSDRVTDNGTLTDSGRLKGGTREGVTTVVYVVLVIVVLAVVLVVVLVVQPMGVLVLVDELVAVLVLAVELIGDEILLVTFEPALLFPVPFTTGLDVVLLVLVVLLVAGTGAGGSTKTWVGMVALIAVSLTTPTNMAILLASVRFFQQAVPLRQQVAGQATQLVQQQTPTPKTYIFQVSLVRLSEKAPINPLLITQIICGIELQFKVQLKMCSPIWQSYWYRVVEDFENMQVGEARLQDSITEGQLRVAMQCMEDRLYRYTEVEMENMSRLPDSLASMYSITVEVQVNVTILVRLVKLVTPQTSILVVKTSRSRPAPAPESAYAMRSTPLVGSTPCRQNLPALVVPLKKSRQQQLVPPRATTLVSRTSTQRRDWAAPKQAYAIVVLAVAVNSEVRLLVEYWCTKELLLVKYSKKEALMFEGTFRGVVRMRAVQSHRTPDMVRLLCVTGLPEQKARMGAILFLQARETMCEAPPWKVGNP